MDIRKRVAFLIILYNFMIYKYFNKMFDKNEITFYPNYTQNEITPYAKYNEKDIYIVENEEFIIEENGAVCVVDSRYDSDPNMKIMNSCDINDLREMRDILMVLKQYENDFPSNWNRTISSMEYEWILHNVCYRLCYERCSTKDVDLNNNDEGRIIPKPRVKSDFK